MRRGFSYDDPGFARIPEDKEDLHLRHSAYHESGHAAVALYIGCLVREAYIYDERGSYAGDTKFDIPRLETKDKADRKACIVGLSGIAAALKYDPCRDPRSKGDEERVRGIMRAFPASDRLALYIECEAKASELVTLLWPQICKIAKAFESKPADSNGKRLLNQEEVVKIYESARRGDSTP